MVNSNLNEAEQYIQAMWRSDYGDRTEVLEAGFGGAFKAAFTAAGFVFKRYAPWIKKELPRLATKLVKEAQNEDGCLQGTWGNVKGWFGGGEEEQQHKNPSYKKTEISLRQLMVDLIPAMRLIKCKIEE